MTWLYSLAVIALSLYGFNALVLLALAAWGWLRYTRLKPPPPPATWPTVLVQLPIFNERYVVERLIDAAAALDYPPDRLIIQVLDDSTDDTTAIAGTRAAQHRARGKNVQYVRRAARSGFKAGALAEGLRQAPGEFVAVFDADFVPPADFLRRVLPHLAARPELGMVQTRWTHLNASDNWLTRAQAISIDNHFGVEQMGRCWGGLFMNFNGSGGVWRRAAIESAGGWHSHTLVEDLDLSYRAQLCGWRFTYLPDVAVPAEIPASINAFKRQQFRWAKGSYQVLGKLIGQLGRAPISPWRKIQGLLHLSGYIGHPLMVIILLCCLPVVLARGQVPLQGNLLGLAGVVPVLVTLFSQAVFYRDWPKRLCYYPMLILLGFGLALNNTYALFSALFSRQNHFVRTPKASAQQRDNLYTLPLDWTTWAEIGLMLYALGLSLLATETAPALFPLTLLYVGGFGYTAGLSLWQSSPVRRLRGRLGETEP